MEQSGQEIHVCGRVKVVGDDDAWFPHFSDNAIRPRTFKYDPLNFDLRLRLAELNSLDQRISD